MKKITGIGIVCVCLLPAFGQAPKGGAAAKEDAAAISETVQKLERDWEEAIKTGDAGRLGEILGADWRAISADGSIEDRRRALNDVKTGAVKLESYELGPMDVKVLMGGRMAVVQGSDTEKSTDKGKDTSGKYVWMDVFMNRQGKWVAVRSQTAWLK